MFAVWTNVSLQAEVIQTPECIILVHSPATPPCVYGEGPRSRRTAALRVIILPYYEDGQFFFSFFRVTEHRWNEIDRGKLQY
jgi:hypothetical protein